MSLLLWQKRFFRISLNPSTIPRIFTLRSSSLIHQAIAPSLEDSKIPSQSLSSHHLNTTTALPIITTVFHTFRPSFPNLKVFEVLYLCCETGVCLFK
mmetsp:Transcript_5420/g.11873  ORF Transcript_5420/g.11873 Transcript_5420/m.11873 type:complete len:97 (+) Transcript_5420:701-991(+)